MRPPTLQVLQGDCRETLKQMPSGSVHTCVTSPPYLWLRDYKIPPSDWPEVVFAPASGLPQLKIPSQRCVLGLEKDLWAFVGHLALVFREIKRVLRDDGTLWMNLGDTFAANRTYQVADSKHTDVGNELGMAVPNGLKAKDLIGVPWRTALALQSDGWFLRMDNVWEKRNPMPESVDDRPTKAHEYFFLLSKSPKYFYDSEAVGEPVSGTAHARGDGVNPKSKTAGINSRVNVDRDVQHEGSVRRSRQNESFSAAVSGLVWSRNKRSVWSVATAPFSGAHFATFPPDLIRPCILAGTSAAGCCPTCGAPLERITESRATGKVDYNGKHSNAGKESAGRNILAHDNPFPPKKTLGWQPTCTCPAADPVPCVVLDPFGGSGTTAQVALELGRSAVLCELNPEYIKLIHQRTQQPGLALA